jgi:hypothetical protein
LYKFSNFDRNPPSLTSELINEKYSEELLNELGSIPNYWDELGVFDRYRSSFLNMVIDLDYSVRVEYIKHELNNLSKFREMLLVKK